MDINYQVLPTFAKVHRDTNPFLFVMGPVGSGKSSGCVFQAFFNAMRQKPDEHGIRHSKHLVVRATYPALRSTTIKTWLSWFKDKITITYSTPIIGRIQYPLADGTSVDMEIVFIAVDDDKSAEKLRSLEVTSAHMNEASELTEGTFQLVKTRIKRFPAKKDGGPVRPFIIFDYNAVSTEHWLYRLAEEDKPEGHSFYRQPPAMLKVDGKYVLNPEAENLANLEDGYYETMCMGADEDFINVNVLNNYGEVKRGKPVYKDYSDLEHHVEENILPLRGVPVVVGVDQGLCYTDQVSVQTDTGWKSFEDVDPKKDRVLSRNPANGEIAWVRPNFKVKEWHDGPMLRFTSQNAKFEVTPEHLIPVTTTGSADVSFVPAQDVANGKGKRYVHVTSVNKQKTPRTLFGYNAVDFVSLLGWYLSEGSTERNTNRVTITNGSEEHLNEIEQLVTRLGCTPRRTTRAIRFSDKRLCKLLSPNRELFDTKRVPRWLYHVGPELIEAFIVAFTKGDGHVRTRKNGAVEHVCYTSSVSLRDDLITLAQLAGYYASWQGTKPRSSWHERDQRFITSTCVNYTVRFKKKAAKVLLQKSHWEEFQYTGYRYCLNVPWHTLYIQMNGVSSWNGNTPSAAFTQQAPDGTVIVFDEICTDNCSLKEFCEEHLWPKITTKYPWIINNFRVVCDPATAQRSMNDAKSGMDILKECNLPAKLAKTNNWTPRFEAVAQFLRLKGRFKLGPNCIALRKGFVSEYKYAESRTVNGVLYKANPVKNEFSHIHDALQYAMMEYVHKREKKFLFNTQRKYRAASQIGGY